MRLFDGEFATNGAEPKAVGLRHPRVTPASQYVPVRQSAVDCSADPLNLGYVMQPVANIVMNRWREREDNTHPLYVLVGEYHNMPTQVLKCAALDQLLVQDTLNGRPPRVLVQMEYPRNWRDILAHRYPHCSLSSLKATPYLASMYWDFAEQSRYTLAATFNRLGVEIQHIDAAQRKNMSTLLKSDPYTRAAVAENVHLTFSNNTISPECMALRDWVMANTPPAQVNGHKPDIIIRSLGSAHLLGDVNAHYLLENSQAALHARMGHDVVCCWPALTKYNMYLSNSVDPNFKQLKAAFLHVAEMRGMNESQFDYHRLGDLIENKMLEEQDLLEAIRKASARSGVYFANAEERQSYRQSVLEMLGPRRA